MNRHIPLLALLACVLPAPAFAAERDADAAKQDEVRRKLLKPKVTEEEALSILLDLYIADGFDNTDNVKVPRVQVLQELDSYDDVNYLVKIDGEKALLKIHNGVESEQYIAAQAHVNAAKRAKVDETDTPSSTSKTSNNNNSIIDLHSAMYQHLAQEKYNVTTGKTICGKNETTSSDDTSSDSSSSDVCIRELSVISADHSPQQLVIRLQSWVHGTPLSSIQWCPIETLVDCGIYLGNMCHALDDLASTNSTALASAKRYHAWDGKHLLDVKPYVSHIDDDKQSKLVTSVIDTFEKVIVEGKEGEKFRMGIIHGDFNDANIVSALYQ